MADDDGRLMVNVPDGRGVQVGEGNVMHNYLPGRSPAVGLLVGLLVDRIRDGDPRVGS